MLVSTPEVSSPIPTIEQRINRVLDEISTTARRVGRDPATVKILAVSKQKTTEHIRTLMARGFREFGESYVAEALPKIESIASADCIWHYVGVVQSNKTKHIAQYFDWVQSLDRMRIAQRLAVVRDEFCSTPLNVCVQVNIDEEPTKAGVTIDEVPKLVEKLQQFSQLQVRGLMAIPNPTTSLDSTRSSFRQMRELFERMQTHTTTYWDTLSMGMSADYGLAIEEGATMVRIGTALFGARL